MRAKNECIFQEYNPHTMTEDEVKLLTIQRLQRNDSGTYLCRVLNEYGYTDLLHYLNVLPAHRRPIATSSSGRRSFLFNSLPDEILIPIICLIGLLFLIFAFFLVYHYRKEKSLRQTLLATRILASRGINTLKNVSYNYR